MARNKNQCGISNFGIFPKVWWFTVALQDFHVNSIMYFMKYFFQLLFLQSINLKTYLYFFLFYT